MEDFFFPVRFASKFPVLAGITTRSAGNAKLEEKKRQIARRLNISYSRITTGEQVHKDGIAIVGEKDPGRKFPAVDGLITNQSNIPLAIFVADCPPIFILDPQKKIGALLHAGWRSTVAGICPRAVEIMSRVFRVKPKNLLVVIGPHICKECYQVPWSPVAKAFSQSCDSFGKEVLSSIISKSSQRRAQFSREGLWSIDLAKANFYQFERAGVLRENIEISSICTYEDKNFFSYRRDKTSAGRMMALFQLNFSVM